MTQRKLFIGALALTLAVAGFLFVTTQPELSADAKFVSANCATPKYFNNHTSACKKAGIKPSPSPTKAKKTTPTPKKKITPSPVKVTPSPSPKLTPSPTPSTTSTPVSGSDGKSIAILQIPTFKAAENDRTGADPVLADKFKSNQGPGLTLFDTYVPGSENAHKLVWNYFLYQRTYIAGVKQMPRIDHQILGPLTGGIGKNYFISNNFQSSSSSTNWQFFGFRYRTSAKAKLIVSYKVSDTLGTSELKQTGWTDVAVKGDGKIHTVQVQPNQSGKYFQYKIQIVGVQNYIDNVGILGTPDGDDITTGGDDNNNGGGDGTGGGSDESPSPNVSPSVVASVGPAGEGSLTIHSMYLPEEDTSASSDTPTTTSSNGPLLPGAKSPSPVASAAPKDPCIAIKTNGEDAAGVPVTVKQTDTFVNGSTGITIKDQQTDGDGLWQGLDGNVDTFPAATYQIGFGDYQSADYKLVAFCDPDIIHIVKTQSDPLTKRATVVVRNGQTTNLIALYAPRSKPYITMNKFAIPTLTPGSTDKIPVLRVVYPGQKFNYLIKYQNTGGEKAKDIVIRDVIPSQLEVDEAAADEGDNPILIEPDPRGATLVTKNIGDLEAGASGSFMIPVKLKADAFTSSGVLVP